MTLPAVALLPEVPVSREGLRVEAWEHWRDEDKGCWWMRVRWSDGIVQTELVTDRQMEELGPLHVARALLP